MVKSTYSYKCFDQKGETNLPSNQLIEEFYQEKIEPVIFLDSCVCLHIIKVIDHKKLAKNVDFSRLLSLKEYLSNHPNIRINSIFALLELCSLSSGFDSQKLHDFKLRIDFFEQLPFKYFKNFRYDFYRDIFVIKDLSKTCGCMYFIILLNFS